MSTNFKLHNFKVGQLVAVKNHLQNTFETKFVSDYRILKIVNKCTLLIKSPNGKTPKIKYKYLLYIQNSENNLLLTSFHSLTWPLHQVCMGKCLAIQY